MKCFEYMPTPKSLQSLKVMKENSFHLDFANYSWVSSTQSWGTTPTFTPGHKAFVRLLYLEFKACKGANTAQLSYLMLLCVRIQGKISALIHLLPWKCPLVELLRNGFDKDRLCSWTILSWVWWSGFRKVNQDQIIQNVHLWWDSFLIKWEDSLPSFNLEQ